MTPLSQQIKVMEAFDNCGKIEARMKGFDADWVELDYSKSHEFDWASNEYRIKPREPREFAVVINSFGNIVSQTERSLVNKMPEDNCTVIRVREVLE